MNCSACGRTLTRPKWLGGLPYGSTCFKRVAPMQRAAAAVKEGARRRRAGKVIAARRAADPRQLALELEVR